jgi:hypothetical protein
MAQANLIDEGTGAFWNPASMPNPPTVQPAGNGVAPNAGNQRESFHWATIPEAYRNIPGIQDWANDPSADPGKRVQDFLVNQRLTPRTDQGDAAALSRLGQPSGGQPSLAAGFPNQFDDPYTNLLEQIAKSQMGQIRSNPGFDQLTQFLNSQFQELSTAPGFSPAEMSVLNTQAFEPIEELRKAGTERSLQRTQARGFLPSSGLAELDLRNVDQAADKLRTQANRDLAINAIDRRDSDLARAGQIAGQVGLTIPQGQRAEELNLANLLYGLPRNALNDALAVLNGSPSTTDLLGGANLQAQQSYIQQQQTAQRWAQIAQFLAGLGL